MQGINSWPQAVSVIAVLAFAAFMAWLGYRYVNDRE